MVGGLPVASGVTEKSEEDQASGDGKGEKNSSDDFLKKRHWGLRMVLWLSAWSPLLPPVGGRPSDQFPARLCRSEAEGVELEKGFGRNVGVTGGEEVAEFRPLRDIAGEEFPLADHLHVVLGIAEAAGAGEGIGEC